MAATKKTPVKQANNRPKNRGHFQPGRSGNPAGRPKARTLSERLRELLGEPGDDGVPNDEAIAQAMIREARRGDLAFIREVLDRVEGKPVQRTKNEHGGLEGARPGAVTIYVPDNSRDADDDRAAAGAPRALPVNER